jgi:prophage maintenance system killer protein
LVASVFLQVNGLKVIADEDAFEKLVMDAAQSIVTKDQIAEFFRSNTASE